jgi:hypothetical protein
VLSVENKENEEETLVARPGCLSSVVWFWFVGAVSFLRPRGLGQGGLKR